VLADLERVLYVYVARLRSDPATPTAHGSTEAQVEDHLASFLADLAGTLQTLADADGAPENAPQGSPNAALRDSTAIQRVVSERHGVQRARLGWAESELRREFEILREELAAAVRRRAVRYLPGPTPEAREEEGERALELFNEFIAVAERLSIASYRQAVATGDESMSDNRTADRTA
jgi:hypothetical protein